MIRILAAHTDVLLPAELPAAVRRLTGQSLRRTSRLQQLALLGALSCLPAERRESATALLWQSASGARAETLQLVAEVAHGSAEPMPYDFLATQPALAGPQIQAFLPGLALASHWPLATPADHAWDAMLLLAHGWLMAGRYAQVLCARLDVWPEQARGEWLVLARDSAPPPGALCLWRGAEADGRCTALSGDADLPARLLAVAAGPGFSAIPLASRFPCPPVFCRL